MHSLLIVTTTFSSREEAQVMARGLVQSQLAACCQITGPIESVYPWKGAIESSQEWRLDVKTLPSFWDAVEAYIRTHHSYEIPEILAMKTEQVDPRYQEWVESTLRA